MKNIIFISLVLLAACGKTHVHPKKGADGAKGADGSSCSVIRESGGSKITCSDGTYSYVYDGSSSSCTVSGNENGSIISCSDGSSSEVSNGEDGQNGTSCSVSKLEDETTITCGESSAVVVDGAKQNTSMVKFCKQQTVYPSTFPEYGICVDGTLFAVYWDGRNSWLSEVVEGSYMSTSTSAPCNFEVLPKCKIKN